MHPALLDGAIQTVAAALGPTDDDESYLPVGLDRGRVHRAAGLTGWGHARVSASAAGAITADVWLRNDDGEVVAELQGLRLQRASRASMRRGLVDSTREWLYEIEWQAQPDAAQALSSVAAVQPGDVAQVIEARSHDASVEYQLDLYDEALPEMEALSVGYVVQGFDDLGWVPVAGERVTADALASRCRIVETQRRLVGRLLEMLGEIGVLRADGSAWEVVSTPTVPDTRAALERLIARYGTALGRS